LEDAEDWDRVPLLWLTLAVSAAVQVTPFRLRVKVSVPEPVAVPWLVRTSLVELVLSESLMVVDVKAAEVKY
jgi:hypothetical protein